MTDEGIVLVNLVGACKECPGALGTLRMGDVRTLYLLRDEEPSLVERAREYYRQFIGQES